MTTKSFPPSSVNFSLGTPADALAGTIPILMKTARYYTDGTRLAKGVTYSVDLAWGKMAVESGWASTSSALFPEEATPSLKGTSVSGGVNALVTASGDTTGAADVVAIQAALTAGGVVTLPSPAYVINNTLVVKSNSRLQLGSQTRLSMAEGIVTKPVLKNYAYSASRLAISTLVWDGNGPGITATCASAHGYSVGDWAAIHGANESGYNGVFRVGTVTSATVFKYQATLIPVAASATASSRFSGMTTILADVNIVISGGIWSWGNTGQALLDTPAGNLINIFNANSVLIENCVFDYANTRCVFAANTRGLTVRNVRANKTAVTVLVEGPAYTTRVHDIVSYGTDDCVVFQPSEWATNPPEWLSDGDIVGAIASNITSYNTGKAVRCVNSGGLFYGDAIEIDTVIGYSPDAAVTIEGEEPNATTGKYGRVSIRNISSCAYNAAVRVNYAAAENISIEGITVNTLNSTWYGYRAVDVQNSSIQLLKIGKLHTVATWSPNATASLIWLRSNNTAIYAVLLEDSHIVAGTNCTFATFDCVSNFVALRNIRAYGGQTLFYGQGSFNLIDIQDCMVDGATYSCRFPDWSGFSCTANIQNLRTQNGTNALRIGGTVTVTIQGSGFSFPGMTAVSTNGAPTINMQTFNLPVNLSSSVFAKATGNYATHSGTTNNGPCTSDGATWKNINSGVAPT